MQNKYGFYNIFSRDANTGLLYPLVNVWINGLYYPAGTQIPQGLSFGGLNLYNYMGRDIAGIWNPNNPPSLTISGFY